MPSLPPLSPDAVLAYAAGVLDHRVVEIRALAGSVANQDFLVRLDDGSGAVIKVGPGQEMAAEAWACRRLTAGLGAPVPGVIALELDSPLGAPTLVLSFLEGAATDAEPVAFEAGRWLRLIHTEKPSGFGPLVVDPADPGSTRGRYGSWPEAVEADLSGMADLVRDGVLDADVARRAHSCVLHDAVVGYASPGVLLHNDLKSAHLFGLEAAGGWQLSGIIDWGDARVGDPVADLARLSMAGPAVTDAFLAGYQLPLTPDLADLLARYRICWNVAALTYEHRTGGDWYDAYRDRIRADTELLSR